MARNKNSTALFDVIHAAKKPPKASPSASIPTPRWWGKDKPVKKVPTRPSTTTNENVGRQQSWLSAAKKSAGLSAAPIALPTECLPVDSLDADVDHAAESENATEPVAPAPTKTRFIDRFVNRTASAVEPVVVELADASPAPAEPIEAPAESLPVATVEADKEWTDSEFVQIKPTAAKPVVSRDPAFRIDPTSKEFRFRLSYGGLIAIGFIVLMALAIAFIAGTHSTPETAQSEFKPAGTKAATGDPAITSGLAVAVSKSDATKLVSSPSVMDVNHKTKPAVILENTAEKPQAPLLPVKSTREIGMNYVVIQSYAELDLAQKACDFLNQSGVPCTLVQGPAEWAPHDWYSVIGLQPFAKRDPALPDYERKVRTIGSKFSNNILNQFDPRAYSWRDNSDMGQ